jgi:hypothetical protein
MAEGICPHCNPKCDHRLQHSSSRRIPLACLLGASLALVRLMMRRSPSAVPKLYSFSTGAIELFDGPSQRRRKVAGPHQEVLLAQLDSAAERATGTGPCRSRIGVRRLLHESGWIRQSPVSRRTGRVPQPPSRSIHVAVADRCLAVGAGPRRALWPSPIRSGLPGHRRYVRVPGICARSAYRGSQRAQRPPSVTHRFAQEAPAPANRANCTFESHFGHDVTVRGPSRISCRRRRRGCSDRCCAGA